MGTDIHGWVEIHEQYAKQGEWDGTVKVEHLLLMENYDIFGCLFGVRNNAGFSPVVGIRGLPEDASSEARLEIAEWELDAHSPSWITWAEIASINWNEKIFYDDSGERIKWRDTITPAWRLVFRLMETLAEAKGADAVRLVVWFDN